MLGPMIDPKKRSTNPHAVYMREYFAELERTGRLGLCKIEGCQYNVKSGGLCKTHASRKHNKSKISVDAPAIRSDGVSRDGAGYVMVRMLDHPAVHVNGYVYQHRLVMESMIGRFLEKHENVHHKNGVRTDNRPENLELWSKSQPYGQRVIDKVVWAREILAKYENDVVSGLIP